MADKKRKRGDGPEVRWTSERIAVARVTLKGRERPPFHMPGCKTDPEAQERAKLLGRLAKRFRLANVSEKDRDAALNAVAVAGSDRSLKAALAYCEELLGGQLEDIGAPKAHTFEDVGKWWTSGKAHAQYPDKIDSVTAAYMDENAQRLERVIYPKIGPSAIDRVTREDCDRVMADLPEGLSRSTRRQYAGLMNRILNLAELAGYIQRNPLPRGWLPRANARKRFPILYPREDLALLACTEIPLSRRILYGYLHREGSRRGEAADLQRRDVDLNYGTVNLDENKTDHARSWKLCEGVPEALAAWLALNDDAKPGDRVFTDENGGPLNVDRLAIVIRSDLQKAGIDRTDLFSRGPNKGRFGTHCFRRSMVTRNLALGRTDDWVRQRTGHKSEELLTYRQAARSVAELNLGDLDPLVLCIPELSPIPGMQAGLAHLARRGVDTDALSAPLTPNPLPQNYPTDLRLGDRLTAGRKILVLAI